VKLSVPTLILAWAIWSVLSNAQAQPVERSSDFVGTWSGVWDQASGDHNLTLVIMAESAHLVFFQGKHYYGEGSIEGGIVTIRHSYFVEQFRLSDKCTMVDGMELICRGNEPCVRGIFSITLKKADC
jgi:hypothetical protein